MLNLAHDHARLNGREARVATALHDAFGRYQAQFTALTRRARRRFEMRDWSAAQADATERLALYRDHVNHALEEVGSLLGNDATDVPTWEAIRWLHAALIVERDDWELAETFYNSVARRIFSTVGVNERVEYVHPPSEPASAEEDPGIWRRYPPSAGTTALVRQMLSDVRWRVAYRDIDADASAAATRIEQGVAAAWGDATYDAIEMLKPVFFRNKGAYLVGRIRRGREMLPLLLPLLNGESGIMVDAVLTTSDEASIVFGFSWSYFQVDISHPRALVAFLASIMPLKRIDELYTAIGYNKHGKTELYQALKARMDRTPAAFDFTAGDQGLVMAVFAFPAMQVVFKVIKDSFGAPKRITRQGVMDKYRFVFVRDRVGRLADAQEFEHLEFDRARFSEKLLHYLREVAGTAVQVSDDRVVLRHLYTERQVTPLNVYLRDADPRAAADAIIDYGLAIKDLAAANIFTGDMLLKNFGVSRHGRVICYDYDELCLLTDCNFRAIPQPRTPEDEMASEPWYHVGEMDVFPEEFGAFLVPAGELREVFLAHHADLLTVDFWRGTQRRIQSGELFDVFPYRSSRRLSVA